MKKLFIFLLTGLFPTLVFSSRTILVLKNSKNSFTSHHKKAESKASAVPQTQYPLLRLKMIKDEFNSDDIAIAFNAAGTLTYNNQLDSEYLPGIDAPEGLCSLSSDSVQLAVNVVPLPKQAPLIIKLDVEAANSGSFTMQRTELDTIPAIYDFWLIDKYLKDSVDLRKTTNYYFSIDKTKSASFGSNRFEVVVRQSAALSLKLLSFNAVKSAGKTAVTWTTANEGYISSFIVERSIDNGANYYPLTTVAADSLGSYSVTDNNPVSGTDTYRLKITDFNGAVTYSNIVTLTFEQESNTASNLSIYPNPSRSVINLTINQNTTASAGLTTVTANSTARQTNLSLKSSGITSYTIRIMNITGSVLTTSTSSANTWQGYVSSLSPGTYIIRVMNNSDNSLVGSGTFVKL